MATGPHTIRIARTAPAALDHTFVVGETPTDPTGNAATIAITAADGSTVVASTAAIYDTAGRFTYALAGQADLNLYYADWTATFSGSAVVDRDIIEIVGARYFTLKDGRDSDELLADTAKYPLSLLEDARLEVEQEIEQICDRAFVPSYRRAVLDGTGTSTILLTDTEWAARARSAGDIRRIRSATIAPRYGETAVALTVGELAACAVTADGSLRRTDGRAWTEGTANVVIVYEYGLDRPPADLIRAAFTRFRARLNIARSGIPDRASSFTVQGGGSYRLDLPDTYKTGIPDVDAVYGRYSRRAEAGTGDTEDGSGRPASRTLTFNPQRASMFHGKGF